MAYRTKIKKNCQCREDLPLWPSQQPNLDEIRFPQEERAALDFFKNAIYHCDHCRWVWKYTRLPSMDIQVEALGIYGESHSPDFVPFAHEDRTWGMRYVKKRKRQ